ncbi:MAG: hypothetical protein A3G24_13125 [Betaproteobacteria bacterium RIFCSPLOWO2_12_FULL_62_13]|nr:MAG: hypothetical protein A3G24_13125 [Betaproteobacteria bacterium RIFCSPLOWO2_12_FULL_62_13]
MRQGPRKRSRHARTTANCGFLAQTEHAHQFAVVKLLEGSVFVSMVTALTGWSFAVMAAKFAGWG